MTQLEATKPSPQPMPRKSGPSNTKQRESSRVVIDLAARLQLDGESPLQVTVHDVSLDSVQIRCRAADVTRLLPARGRANFLNVWLHLPFQVGALNLKAGCLVTHVTEHCDDTLGLDLQFEQFSRIGARILQMFIEESAQASSHGPAKQLFQAGAASAHGEVTNAAPLARPFAASKAATFGQAK